MPSFALLNQNTTLTMEKSLKYAIFPPLTELKVENSKITVPVYVTNTFCVWAMQETIKITFHTL